MILKLITSTILVADQIKDYCALSNILTNTNDVCPFVSVVVPTYNREEVLCNTIVGLLSQDYPNCEVIVVDQTKQHNPITENFLLQHRNRFRLIRIHPPSLPKARNIGALLAKGEIVIYVDDDIIPEQGLISAHAKSYSSKKNGGVAGRRTIPGLSEPSWPIGRIGRFGRHISNFSSTSPCKVQWASGCHMSFRRDLIFRVGMFEQRFLGTAAYEDVDFCFRIRALGYDINFVPEAHLIHLMETVGGCTNRERNTKFYYSAIHNFLLFSMRHFPLSELPLIFLNRVAVAFAYARARRNPFLILPLAGAFGQVFLSYFASRSSLKSQS